MKTLQGTWPGWLLDGNRMSISGGTDAVDNALWSHAYTFIYDPFTHTGVLGTLNLTDTWSVQGGLVLGSDIFIDPADTPTGIASLKWVPPGGRDSVLFSCIIGSGRFNQ